LARILETWMLAVLGVMNSSWPICRLVLPAATSARTSALEGALGHDLDGVLGVQLHDPVEVTGVVPLDVVI
jgi:hypothetical protein